ncbi:uncharacterized protein LOC117334162 [Pecten maximus]|uniref:uncharacterized protein LOC117334162 n=1 Tax=Pecten maximus TaxID=6579 RepID=UPI001457F366|nr:uncharacterized protein LOC117334162 [Pecten maximus]
MHSKKSNGKGRASFFETLFKIDKDQVPLSKENFVLNMVLPVFPVAESVKEAQRLIKEEQTFLFYGTKLCSDMQLLVGSSTDGLALPEIRHVARSRSYTEAQDEDIIYLFPYLKIDPSHRRAFARPIPIREHPGYVQLAFNTDWLYQRQNYYDNVYISNMSKSNFENPTEFVDSEGFVLRAKLTRKLKRETKLEDHNYNDEEGCIRIHEGRNVSVEYSHHGPALTTETREHTYNIHHSKDYVLALPHPSWPSEAAAWRHRVRTWPPVSVINAAVKCGCHVVAKSHKNSKDPREFILSFGLASRTVAHALNIAQFRCYKLFKYLFCFHIGKVKRGMSTFHCKQVMYWVCERSNQEDWTEDNPFECLQRLLYQMEEFLSLHNLPHYFIAENNTIAHISAASVAAIKRDVTKVRDTCWAVILELIETKRFWWLSRDISLTTILSARLSGDELTKQNMAMAVLNYVSELLDKGEVSMVFYLLGVDMLHDMAMNTFIDVTIDRIEQALKIGPNTSTMCCLNGLLASLYHQRGVSTKYSNIMIEKSRAIFHKALEDVGTHIWIYGEYYNLLTTTKQHQLLLEHFASHLASSRQGMLYHGGIYNSINFHNRLTMDMCVQEAIVDCSVPSTAFLFFKIIQTLTVLHKNQVSGCSSYHVTATKAVTNFDAWAKLKALRFPEMCDEHVQVLLAYSYDCVGRPDGAEKYFAKAASFGVDYKDEEESDDIIMSTPVVIRLRRIAEEQRSRNTKPYKRPSGRKQMNDSGRNIILKFGEVRINPFVHG